ncbi:hypothetical protein EON67_09235 [archaeon]|nr:MAG: hypothetical protein EON67_09235 [archaeon]
MLVCVCVRGHTCVCVEKIFGIRTSRTRSCTALTTLLARCVPWVAHIAARTRSVGGWCACVWGRRQKFPTPTGGEREGGDSGHKLHEGPGAPSEDGSSITHMTDLG